MIVLDTNVLSELMRPKPEQSVLLWIEAQPADEFYISTLTMAEILHGIARLPDDRADRDDAARPGQDEIGVGIGA